VELRHPEPIGVEHRHHGRVRDIDTDFDDGRRDEHVDPAGRELGHRSILLLRRKTAV
jgi:hypothetical protein